MAAAREAKSVLRTHRLRVTGGRVRLLSILLKAPGPLSHAEIMRALEGHPMNRVSVYRNLETFVNAGIVHRAYVDERTWLFETSDRCSETACHPHFTCRRCGKVQCLNDAAVGPLVGVPVDYRIERMRVHVQGLCPSCAPG